MKPRLLQRFPMIISSVAKCFSAAGTNVKKLYGKRLSWTIPAAA
jgi:hypothetical protein